MTNTIQTRKGEWGRNNQETFVECVNGIHSEGKTSSAPGEGCSANPSGVTCRIKDTCRAGPITRRFPARMISSPPKHTQQGTHSHPECIQATTLWSLFAHKCSPSLTLLINSYHWTDGFNTEAGAASQTKIRALLPGAQPAHAFRQRAVKICIPPK